MAIYTKKGDRGKTALFDAKSSQRNRISKSSLKVEAIGAIDELNSYIGIAIASSKKKNLNKLLEKVQDNLLRIGSITAGSSLRFSKVQTKKLEKKIDELEGSLPTLKNFIFPGGSKLAAHIHYARTLSRGAERRMVVLNEHESIKPQILTYLNRLSDYLFMLARYVNIQTDNSEKIWKPGK